MTRPTQGILLAFLGAVLLRLAFTDAYLRYVTDWMKWPIIASGVILMLLAIGPILSDRAPASDDEHGGAHDDEHDAVVHDPEALGADAHGHGHGGVPRVTWLLLLPGLVTFLISPPALGSYLAERRADESVTAQAPAVMADLPDGDVVPLELQEFLWRAHDASETIAGRSVQLTGFVSYDRDDNWYVTRLAIGCCAADAMAYRVRVDGPGRPPRDQWVQITGTYVDGSAATGRRATPTIAAADVTPIAEPEQTYE
ncbi:TIGR03943 family protein [Nocardioides sp.]|uniref:TIGR03943 family putative permease subunit n=1 Tax=Nocardioides sp. TaxID=35761 RepID=UPI0027355B17|nr:TIGR03943 family protein [Nocardioides sp.]MDP3893241.1 TIGR03943 family protein [Nocardioides sp.]